MNPRAQQIAIAKAAHDHFELHPTDLNLMADGDGGWKEIPDYLYDLNAMHEAENALLGSEETWETYTEHLMTITVKKMGYAAADWVYRASAAIRAEAFLKTLNLWDDSK